MKLNREKVHSHASVTLGARGCSAFVVGHEGRSIVGRTSRVEGRKGSV